MKGMQNKIFIPQKLIVMTYLLHVTGKENSESSRFRVPLARMCHLVTFSELSNDVDTTGTGSMHVMANRVAIS
jgi:hypothetical protein